MRFQPMIWRLAALSWACAPSEQPSETETHAQAVTAPRIEWDSELGQNKVWINDDEFYLERKPGNTVN